MNGRTVYAHADIWKVEDGVLRLFRDDEEIMVLASGSWILLEKKDPSPAKKRPV